MSTADEQDRPANVREEIAARVARFKATQEKFAREREEFYVATMERALNDTTRPPKSATSAALKRGGFKRNAPSVSGQ